MPEEFHNQPVISQPYRILSLDGGGAKGFYTIGILSEIESMLGQPIYKSFDLIFGTSTGAIIAALLARGESVEKVHDLYKSHVPEIMKSCGRKPRTVALHKLANEVFEKDTVAGLKTGIGIVTTNWTEEKPMVFKSSVNQAHGSKSSFVPFFGVSVADAIIGSCSAYPFFDLHMVKKSNGDLVQLGDGGFCANNPTLYAIGDAIGALKLSQENLKIVSLGVGSYPTPSLWTMKALVKHWDILCHVPNSNFLQKILGTNTGSMDILLRHILFKNVPIVRISDTFAEPAMATDLLEHDLKKLNRLVQKGRNSFSTHESKLRELLTDLEHGNS